jgi:hypothetical protein
VKNPDHPARRAESTTTTLLSKERLLHVVRDEQDRPRHVAEGPQQPLLHLGLVIESSAPNGSSSSSTSLSATSVRRKLTRCRMPPDSCAGRTSSNMA